MNLLLSKLLKLLNLGLKNIGLCTAVVRDGERLNPGLKTVGLCTAVVRDGELLNLGLKTIGLIGYCGRI